MSRIEIAAVNGEADRLAAADTVRARPAEARRPEVGEPIVRSMTDLLGRERRIAYRGSGAGARLLWVEEADGARARYEYDPAGRLAARADARGRTTRYAYDAAGRLERVESPLGRAVELTWDAEGQLIRRAPAGAAATEFRYRQGRLGEVRFGARDRARFLYDAAGRLAEVREPAVHTRYRYDGGGSPSAVERSFAGRRFLLRCDAEGNALDLELPGGERIGLRADAAAPAPPAFDEPIVTDRMANVTALGEERFEYDERGQLVGARSPAGGAVEYRYDACGNRVARRGPDGDTSYEYGPGDLLLSIVGPDGVEERLAYDAAGRLTSRSSRLRELRYEYDDRGRLSAVWRDGRRRVRYRYDFEGRRVERRAGSRVDLYHHDPRGRLVAITGPDGRPRVSFPASADRALARVHSPDGEVRELALEVDSLGSTRRITDAAGATAWRGDYSPFGRLRGPAPDFECPLFGGALWDEEAELYGFEARDYDPGTGRFVTPDPWTAGPDDPRLLARGETVPPPAWLAEPRAAHPYLYCLNNPASYRDPRGLGWLGTVGKTFLALTWSLPWTLVGAGLTVVDWVFQFLLFGFLYLPRYGLTGVASGRLGSAAMINIGGLLNFPLVLANVLFARRGLFDDLDASTAEHIVPVDARPDPAGRELRPAEEAYREHLLRHTVQANYSGPFWPFVYLFGSNAMERNAVRESGFTTIAEPTLTVGPEKILSREGAQLIVVGGQRPYTAEVLRPNAGAVEAFTDNPTFSEAHYAPEYLPGKVEIRVSDMLGMRDTREVEIERIRVTDVKVAQPADLILDEISDPDVPTIRLVDRAAATLELRIRPKEATVFLESDPAGGVTLSAISGMGTGTVRFTVRPTAAPTAIAAGGAVPQDFIVRVRAWDQNGAELRRIRVRSMATINVVMQAHVVREDDGTDPAFSTPEIMAEVNRLNTVWRQAGIQFQLRPDFLVVDEDAFKVITVQCPGDGTLTSAEDDNMFRHRPTPPGPIAAPNDFNNTDTNAVHLWFVEDLDPTDCATAYASPGYMVVTRDRRETTTAHEMGHALALGHPESEMPPPRRLNERLMLSNVGERGEPFLISNQANPFRPDETAVARIRAALHQGP